jgi:regulator of sirC expression with transglutaminase-like and TPR domain
MANRTLDNTMAKRTSDNTMANRTLDNTLAKRTSDNTMAKRTSDNTMAKRTRTIKQTMIYKVLHRVLKIEPMNTTKPGVDSGAQEG